MNQQINMEGDTLNVPQEGMNPEPEVEVEETTTAEETEETPAEEAPEPTVPKSQFDQVLARAKKAEALLKKQNPPKAKESISNPVSETTIEEKILLSQGMSEELLAELKTLAQVRGKGLIQTQNDPIFLKLKESKEAELKAQKAKLGASKNSSSVRQEKKINSPGLSSAEHKELWREMNGK